MLSFGTHLVKNIQSQSRNNESQMKRIYKFVTENAWTFVLPEVYLTYSLDRLQNSVLLQYIEIKI